MASQLVGGKGIKTINVTPKTGPLISINTVTNQDNLMIINKSGIAINMPLAKTRTMGRVTQGIRLIKLSKGDQIAAARKIQNIE